VACCGGDSVVVGGLPRQRGEQREVLPAEPEAPALLHQRVPLERVHAEQQPALRGGAAGQRHGPEPRAAKLVAPPLDAHLARPLGPAHGHDVPNLRSQELPLGGVLLARAVAQRVEQRRVVVQRLDEAAQEVAAVAEVLLHDGDQLRAQCLEQPHRDRVRPRHVVQAVVHPVHHGSLVFPVGVVEQRRGVPDLPLDGAELQRQPEGGGEVGEAAAGGTPGCGTAPATAAPA
jgi:hypothetical protein